MIRALSGWLTVATELAETSDPRLKRGIWRGTLEAIIGAVPYVCLYFILLDIFSNSVATPRLIGLLVGMFAALAIQVWLGVGAMIDVMTSAYGLFGTARLRVADHIRRLPMGWFSKQRSGALLGVLTSQLDMVAEFWSHFISQLNSGVTIPLTVGLCLMVVDWRRGLVMIAALPLAFGLLALTQKMFTWLGRYIFAAIEDANHNISEYVQGIAVLRGFGRSGVGFERLETSLSTLRRRALQIEIAPAPLFGSYGFAVEAGFSVLVLSGAWLLINDALEPEVFLLFVVVSMKFYGPLFGLGIALLVLRFGQKALERTRAVVRTPTMPETEVSQATPGSAEVRFDCVSFTYEIDLSGIDVPETAANSDSDNTTTAAPAPAPALRDVNLTLRPGELNASVGPAGSGKSTLVHLIARLWDADRGRVTLGGVDVRDLSAADLHARISMVFQDVVLFSGTIAENIRIGNPNATDAQIVAAAKQAMAHEFIEELPEGYATSIGAGGHALSGGEQQRISIARALLKDAEVVLLDEATASVDPAAEHAIQLAIDRLIAGKTVVIIAHRLRTIQNAAQIVVLEEGRVRATGRHAELMQSDELYARLWNMQSGSP